MTKSGSALLFFLIKAAITVSLIVVIFMKIDFSVLARHLDRREVAPFSSLGRASRDAGRSTPSIRHGVLLSPDSRRCKRLRQAKRRGGEGAPLDPGPRLGAAPAGAARPDSTGRPGRALDGGEVLCRQLAFAPRVEQRGQVAGGGGDRLG